MAVGRRMDPGARRRGFSIPVPHTRSGLKHIQGYIQTLRPMVNDIAATLDLDRERLAGREPDDVGAAYLAAFLDDLRNHLEA
jgi:hypothetical protein